MANLLQLLGLAAGPSAAFGTSGQGIPRPIQSIDPNTGIPVSGPIVSDPTGALGIAQAPASEALPQPEIPAATGAPINLLEGTPYDQSNVLQAIGGSPDAPQPAPVPQTPQPAAAPAEAPRQRRSLLDTVGRISDVLARVGGAEALYQPTLDAREDRQFGIEDRDRAIQMQDLQRQLAEQQVEMGAQAPQDMERARIGQVLGAVAQDPQMVGMLPQLLEQAGVDPQRAEAINQIVQQNPQAAGIFAQSLGYEQPRQGSQAKELQVYQMLREQSPELADSYLQSIANPGSMSEYQRAQLSVALENLQLRRDQFENPRPTAAEAKAEREQAASAQSTLRALEQVTAQGGVFDRLDNALEQMKDAGSAYSSEQGVLGRTRTWANQNLPFVEQVANPQGAEARQAVETILNQMVLDFLPLMSITTLGGRNFDAAKELDFHRQRILGANNYGAAKEALDAWRKRSDEMMTQLRQDQSRQSAPAPQRRGSGQRIVPRTQSGGNRQSGTGDIVSVTSLDQARGLPPGTQFRTPDGQVRRVRSQ